MRMSLPVLLVHWNRPDVCVRAVAAFHSQSLPVEITILDNASSAENLERLRAQVAPRAAVRVLSDNLGFGPALNVGLQDWLGRSGAPYIVVAAHDALPHEDCLNRLVEVMERRPRCGMVSAETGQQHVARFTGLRGPHLPSHKRGTGFSPQDFPHGTLLLLRRDCLEDIGCFDVRYFAYGDEIDLGLRARASGWEVGACWDALVDNPERSVPGEVASYLQLRNAIVLVLKWKGRGWALWRSVVSVANTLRLALVVGARPSAYSARSRLLAVRDAWAGRLGPPPKRLTAPRESVR